MLKNVGMCYYAGQQHGGHRGPQEAVWSSDYSTAPRAELGFPGLQNNRLDQTGYSPFLDHRSPLKYLRKWEGPRARGRVLWDWIIDNTSCSGFCYQQSIHTMRKSAFGQSRNPSFHWKRELESPEMGLECKGKFTKNDRCCSPAAPNEWPGSS